MILKSLNDLSIQHFVFNWMSFKIWSLKTVAGNSVIYQNNQMWEFFIKAIYHFVMYALMNESPDWNHTEKSVLEAFSQQSTM